MGTCYLHWFVVSFASSPHPKTILLLGSIDLFNLFLRRVTVLILPTIAPLLYLPLLLKSLNLFSMLIFSNILNLTLFFLITSMVFARRDQLVIRKKRVRFKMFENMSIEKRFKDFSNSLSQSNGAIVGRIRTVTLLRYRLSKWMLPRSRIVLGFPC